MQIIDSDYLFLFLSFFLFEKLKGFRHNITGEVQIPF